MTQKTFEVVFTGQLAEGASLEQVKARVAALFKIEVAKVERLFSGNAVSIKKGVDEATAKKYQLALQKAGALCRVVNRAAAAGGAAQQPAAKPAAAAKQAPAKVPPRGESEAAGLQKSVVKAPPQDLGEFDQVALDEPGVTLVQHHDVPQPEIDTSALSMDQPGATLGEHEEVVPPQVDTGDLSVSGEEEAIGEATPFEPLEVDTEGMSMDDPGVILVEHEEPQKPEIDTSDLSLE